MFAVPPAWLNESSIACRCVCKSNCVSVFFCFGFGYCDFLRVDCEIERAGGELLSLSSRPLRLDGPKMGIGFFQFDAGMRFPNSSAKRLSASRQLWIGMVHFLAIRSKAR